MTADSAIILVVDISVDTGSILRHSVCPPEGIFTIPTAHRIAGSEFCATVQRGMHAFGGMSGRFRPPLNAMREVNVITTACGSSLPCAVTLAIAAFS